MIFGNKEFFLKEHFEKNKGYAPAPLCELVIYCMELLSQLASFPISFRFKGGNSLLLILDQPQRFSIDVDIDTLESKENLISIMETIQKRCPLFKRLEIRQHKTKPWLPMISFNLFFDSCYEHEEEPRVMLDAVLKETLYPGYKKMIRIDPLYASGREAEISFPSGIIGDKLLTLGPRTLGIPLNRNKEAQRLKHVFDIARLCRSHISMPEIKASFSACLEQESAIQQKKFSVQEVIQDTALFCSSLKDIPSQPDLSTLAPGTDLWEITKGFPGFSSHLFNTRYTWEQLRQDMESILSLLPHVFP